MGNLIYRKNLTCTLLVPALLALLVSCASQPPADYNQTGSQGALLRQELGVESNICYYDTGLKIYVQGNCPASVRASVFQRF